MRWNLFYLLSVCLLAVLLGTTPSHAASLDRRAAAEPPAPDAPQANAPDGQALAPEAQAAIAGEARAPAATVPDDTIPKGTVFNGQEVPFMTDLSGETLKDDIAKGYWYA